MGTRRRDLPQGRSWPLRAAQLVKALDEGGVPRPSSIGRYRPYRPDGTVLRIDWHPRSGVLQEPWAGGAEHVSITIHDVSSAERAAVERALLASAVPEVVRWLGQAAIAREGWRV